jgi:hypothetical protein
MEHPVPASHVIPRPFSYRQNEKRNQPVNHKGFGGSLSVDLESLWDIQQRHCRRPSQRFVKFAISWRADHLLTGSRRYYNKECASSVRCHKQQAQVKAWETILENKCSSVLPRSVFVANFRFITGDDCLQRHLDRIGLRDFSDVPTVRRLGRNWPWPLPKMSKSGRCHGKYKKQG